MKNHLKKSIRKFLSDEIYIKLAGVKHLNYVCNLKEPQTFNEKIQYRKLYDNNPLYSLCSDKYKVREYVKEKIGEEYLIPLLYVGAQLSTSDLIKLPSKFVLKTNNGAGSKDVLIIKEKDEHDLEKIKNKFNRSLKEKKGEMNMQKYYDEIDPKIIAEKLLVNSKNEIPNDFKFHCFNDENGKTTIYFMYDLDRDSRNKDYPRQIYDEEFNLLPFELGRRRIETPIKKPENFEKMKELSKELSREFSYVRVDLFSLKGKIYFNELTFCHASGFQKFVPSEWDKKWGRLWKIKK